MSLYILIDAEHLARRAWYSTGGLKHKGEGTGIAYGVIREAHYLLSFYRPDGIAWCFDSSKSKRKEMCPQYKANRITTNDRDAMLTEIKTLRTDILPSLGFRNVFAKVGYEADDVIAKLAYDLHFADKAIIVSSDKDLYQCLRGNISIYNPISKKTYTVKQFQLDWNIHPACWAKVKAIAGCSSDNVAGVPGVAEKTATKWLKNKLKGSKKKLIDKNLSVISRNLPLVSLPMDGIKPLKWNKDKVTRKRWLRTLKRLGIRTIGFPGATNGT